MPIFNKATFSNILILISLIFTTIWYFLPEFILEWSMNNFYLYSWKYFHFILQFFTATFLHSWPIHFLFNAIFIYYFWNLLEIIMWRNKFITFFILSVVFNSLLLSYFSPNTYTIWISGFALAILTYYTLELKSLNNPEYKWWITAIAINLLIWFHTWVSLYGHLFWAIFWIIFFYISNDFTKKQLVWLFKYNNKNKKNWVKALNIKKD